MQAYNVNNTNLVAYYPLNTNFNDYTTGTAVNNASVYGGSFVISTAASKVGTGSAYSPGWPSSSSQYGLQLPSKSITSAGITFSIWVKYASSPTSQTFSRLFQLRNPTFGDQMVLCISGYNLMASCSGVGNYSFSYSFSDTNWHHCCLTCAPDGTWSLYVDGTYIGSPTAKSYPSTTVSYVQKIALSDGTESGLNGYFNQYVFFNRVLTASEISIIYNNPTTVMFTSLPSGVVLPITATPIASQLNALSLLFTVTSAASYAYSTDGINFTTTTNTTANIYNLPSAPVTVYLNAYDSGSALIGTTSSTTATPYYSDGDVVLTGTTGGIQALTVSFAAPSGGNPLINTILYGTDGVSFPYSANASAGSFTITNLHPTNAATIYVKGLANVAAGNVWMTNVASITGTPYVANPQPVNLYKWLSTGTKSAYSFDGNTWSSTGGPVMPYGSKIGYAITSNYVNINIYGDGNQNSSDGKGPWSDTGPTTTTVPSYGAVYGNSYYVAVGKWATTNIQYAKGGIPNNNFNSYVWNNSASSSTLFGTGGYGKTVAYKNNKFVAGGAAGTGSQYIAYSSDANNWTLSPSTLINSSVNGFDWNGTNWVGVGAGTGSTIIYSSDAATWTTAVVNGNLATQANTSSGGLTGVKWANGKFIAVGTDATSPKIYNSTDGINWTTQILASSLISPNLYCVAHDGINWAIGGKYASGKNIAITSTDGVSWSGITSLNSIYTASTDQINAMGVFNYMPQWSAVGTNAAKTKNIALYSYDGMNWIQTTSRYTNGLCVHYNGCRWVAGGSGASPLTHSPDGIDWLDVSASNLISTVYGVHYGNGIWAACGVGNPNPLIWSYDAITWRAATYPALGTGVYAKSVKFNGNSWVAGTAGGTATTRILYSSTGNTWTFSSNTLMTDSVAGIDYGANVWVGVGTSTGSQFIYSGNGITWSAGSIVGGGTPTAANTFSGGATAVKWSRDKFVAVGIQSTTPTVFTSPDGMNWTRITLSTSIISPQLLSVDCNDRILTISAANTGGGKGVIAYSIDAANWAATNTTWQTASGDSIYGITHLIEPKWMFAASTGLNYGLLGYSPDGISWKRREGILNNYGVSNCIIHDGTKWLVSGTRLPGYSYNGYNFSVPSSQEINNSVAYGNGVCICTEIDFTKYCISYDMAATWTVVNSTSIFGANSKTRGIKYKNGVWLMGSSAATGNMCIAYSTNNGNTWTTSNTNLLSTVEGFAYGNGIWIATGTAAAGGSQIIYSTDNGVTWSPGKISGALITTSNGSAMMGYRATWHQNMFVVIGIDYNYPIAFSSTDGANWTVLYRTGSLMVSSYDVASDGSKLLMSGSNGAPTVPYPIIYSLNNGNTWVGHPTSTEIVDDYNTRIRKVAYKYDIPSPPIITMNPPKPFILSVSVTSPKDGTPEPTSYAYSLDNGAYVSVPVASQLTIPNLNIGQHTITLRSSYELNGTTIWTSANTAPYTAFITCFLRGSKILTYDYEAGMEIYRPIETLRRGDLVKTAHSGYKAIYAIGYGRLPYPSTDLNVSGRLYRFSRERVPELTEPALYLTGDHCTLLYDVDDAKLEKIKQYMGDIYVSEGYYRVPSWLDDRCEVATDKTESVEIWHFALENEHRFKNYGVYANGLMVESSSIRYVTECSGFTLI